MTKNLDWNPKYAYRSKPADPWIDGYLSVNGSNLYPLTVVVHTR